jgi:hypothetical protein
MNPIVGIARLLLNPAIRDAMIFDDSSLSSAEKGAGPFVSASIAEEVRSMIPLSPDGRPVLPIYLGWWADKTNVCCGGQ